mmetsp:Transcript_58221/g.189766  ORF Transcript_58221/g.189766 Transcript_58221/m.189766 type:complete len:264 (-) Transcript_58221:62-853(-)
MNNLAGSSTRWSTTMISNGQTCCSPESCVPWSCNNSTCIGNLHPLPDAMSTSPFSVQLQTLRRLLVLLWTAPGNRYWARLGQRPETHPTAQSDQGEMRKWRPLLECTVRRIVCKFFLELLVIDCSAHLGRWQTSSRGPDSRGRLPIGPRDPPCVPSPRHASWPTPGAWRTWTKRACTNRHLRCRVMLPLPLVSHPAEALRLQRRLPCWGSMLGKRPPNQSFPALHWHATTRTQIGKCIAHLARQCCSDAQRCAARPHPEQGGR